MKLFSKEESYISKKMRLYGNVESDSDISIDGSVYGNVRSKKHVMLGATAHFEGNIEGDTVLVCGYFKGTIVAKRMIEVRTPAVISGDLISDSVRVESGVTLQGKVMAKTVEQDCLPDAESAAEEPAPVAVEE
ncbi:MAG: polymer-forming cytoskeletal protein [Alistipes sp.]|nr:polymer-forming cytoskeletal protein [Alistipes sp.]